MTQDCVAGDYFTELADKEIVEMNALADLMASVEAAQVLEDKARSALENAKALASGVAERYPHLASDVYWAHERFASVIPQDVKRIYRDSFVTTERAQCECCNESYDVEFTSWAALRDWKRRSVSKRDRVAIRLICPLCEASEKQRRDESSRLYFEQKTERLHHLRTMPYREYLKTEEWQSVRKQSLKRARYRCQVCNGQGILDVHHRTYERRGCERLGDLTVLCRSCHSTFHDESHIHE